MTSLIQTILWVGLLGVILWRYHNLIHGLLFAIQKRIESGSGIKAGPFELNSGLHPQDPEQQKQKVEQEISEATERDTSAEATALPPTVAPRDDLRTRYFQAEDLALRAIQAEYDIPIARQLQAGRDMGFDGVFVRGGTAHIVEVKYSQHALSTHNIQRIVHTISSRIFSRIRLYGWRNVKLILAIVYDNASIDLDKDKERLLDALQDIDGSVEVRCFSLQQLAKQFGVSP